MSEMKCPFHGDAMKGKKEGTTNEQWWPEKLNLRILEQHSEKVNPLDPNFDYKKAFGELDYVALKEDLKALMKDSQDWWPADYGHYGPLFIRMSWHAAGTYRTFDGRGGANNGNQRFAPLNSWPDNANLDKARRLLWPIKKKYGKKISWADLLVLAGTVALEDMGLKTIGFGAGREDIWEPEDEIYWGAEKEWLASTRYSEGRKLEAPLAAVQMGLIYVNPEGPDGVPDAIASARDIRDTFARMAMNDEETVALIAGGHTFGKTHGAIPQSEIGPEPEAAPIEEMGFGWNKKSGEINGDSVYTSGLEGSWTKTPTKWDMEYLNTLFAYEWNLTKSPAGAYQWEPANPEHHDAPSASDPNKKVAPIMLTSDMALRMDPKYREIALRYRDNPEEFADAFAKAWFKLTHRDMGPKVRYLGPEVPAEDFIWQDPVPAADYDMIGEKEIAEIKGMLDKGDFTVAELVSTAWKSASSFRHSDNRGGANGARIQLEPQISWESNEPIELKKTLAKLEAIKKDFDAAHGNMKVSMADLIVLAGSYGVEKAAQAAGTPIEVPFTPGRTDALQEQTSVQDFEMLMPIVDGFRNFVHSGVHGKLEELFIDKVELLTLTAPEMVALMGGMRAMGATYGNSDRGVFTNRKGQLTQDFFVNLLDMSTKWAPIDEHKELFEGIDRNSGAKKWEATRLDLMLGSNSQLRAIAEVYACDDAKEKFLKDFVKAWVKVMELDRFDVK